MVYEVIIIGAGVSGLSAAKKLQEENRNILVLEARNRIGGRISTDRSLGFPIDLGASWAHDLPNNIIAKQPTAFNIQLLPYHDLHHQLNGHTIFNAENKKLNLYELEKIKKFYCGIAKTLGFQSEDVNLAQLLETYYDPELTKTESIQVKNWLTNFMVCWSGSELAETSIKVWKNMQEESIQAYVLNGYDRLIENLSMGIPIKTATEVQKIDYSTDRIKIYTSQGEFAAQQVIITLPIGVLKRGLVEFIPPLPESKLMAIKNIGLGALEKAVLHFSHCFWDEQALSIELLHSSSSSIQTYINYYALMKKPVLVALYGGNTAKKMEKIRKFKSLESFVAPLKKIYRDQYQDPVNIIHTQWNEDPYSQCSYSFLPRGVNDNCFDRLAEPINNRLYFSGEATHKTMYATVHGAYLSGIKAAEKIIKRIIPVREIHISKHNRDNRLCTVDQQHSENNSIPSQS